MNRFQFHCLTNIFKIKIQFSYLFSLYFYINKIKFRQTFIIFLCQKKKKDFQKRFRLSAGPGIFLIKYSGLQNRFQTCGSFLNNF